MSSVVEKVGCLEGIGVDVGVFGLLLVFRFFPGFPVFCRACRVGSFLIFG